MKYSAMCVFYRGMTQLVCVCVKVFVVGGARTQRSDWPDSITGVVWHKALVILSPSVYSYGNLFRCLETGLFSRIRY